MTGSLKITYGKYYSVLNLKDESGKRKQKRIPLHLEAVPGNKRKAEQAHRKILAEYEHEQKSICRQTTLFCDYVRIWLEMKKGTIELITWEGYEEYIDLHIYPFFKKMNVNLADLSYQHLQKYYNEKKKTLSAQSLRRHHTVINQTLKMALKDDLIANNPAEKVTLPKVEKFTGKFLSVEQGNVLLEVSKGKTMETAIILAMMYGLRRSEIAGLKWSAIDFTNNTIAIKHTVTQHKTTVAKDKTKNKSSNRILPLNSQVKEFLLKMQARQNNEKQLFGRDYKNTEYICRWADGHAMQCNYITKGFKNILVKYGLPANIRFHDLRHSCASYMLKAGCSMKEIADWLGHADISTSMNIYAHLDVSAKQSVANRLGNLLSVKS